MAQTRVSSKKDWTRWQLALWQAFLVDHLLCLQQLVGEWMTAPQQSIHKWHWLMSYATQKLYHWDGQWNIHKSHWGFSNQHPKYCAKPSGTVATLLDDCMQVSLKKTSLTYWTPSRGCSHIVANHTQLQKWEEFVSNLQKKMGFPTPNADRRGETDHTGNHRWKHSSDGSFKEGQGIAAWMIYDMRHPKVSLGQGVITTPGSMTAQGSYWSELVGIYGIVMTINALTKYHGHSQGSILTICDGEATLNKSMKPWTSNPLENHFDIIHAIQVGVRATKYNGQVNT